MKYDFNKIVDRSKYHSVKWDELETIFGAQDVLPMWVADIVNNPLKFESNKYVMDFEDLERKIDDPRIKILILCSPHNPVGRIWQKEELNKLGEICLKHNIIVVSDEIHADILFK